MKFAQRQVFGLLYGTLCYGAGKGPVLWRSAASLRFSAALGNSNLIALACTKIPGTSSSLRLSEDFVPGYRRYAP